MLRIAVLVLALAACGSTKSAKQEKLQAGDIAFVGATVVPMDREGTLSDHTVVVRGDKIVLVGKSSTIDTKGATVIDVKGKWIVPGLADMHVHTWNDAEYPLYLLNGVTTIRDMFGSPKHLDWRSQIAAGKLVGPTLFTAGPIVDGDPPTWPGSAVVTTPDAGREAVREQKKAGYDFIKVYNSLSPDVYDAIVAEAKAQKIPFAGHVPKAVGIEKVLASGQLSIEHLDGYLPLGGPPHVDPQIIGATVKAGTWNCPTLVVTERFGRMDNPASLDNTAGLQYVMPAVRAQWDPKNDFRIKTWTPERFENMRTRNKTAAKLVLDLQKAGANLVLGTDTGNPFVVPGFAVHDELALLVAAGLTPWQALRMATVAPSELVGQKGTFGAVSPGSRADLLIVDGDPTKDIGALAQPGIVMVRGKLNKRAELLAAVDAAKPPADPYAKLPALEKEGEAAIEARYEIVMSGTAIGHERAAIGKLEDGTKVVRGQAVYDTPPAVFQYRATPTSVDFTDGLSVAKQGTKVTAKLKEGKPLELVVPADAVVAPQSIAEFTWYVDKLAKLAVGKSMTIPSAAVMVDASVHLEAASLTFTRTADTEGRRVYAIKGKTGDLDLEGTFSVDADGAPHAIEAKVKWGTFLTRRIE